MIFKINNVGKCVQFCCHYPRFIFCIDVKTETEFPFFLSTQYLFAFHIPLFYQYLYRISNHQKKETLRSDERQGRWSYICTKGQLGAKKENLSQF